MFLGFFNPKNAPVIPDATTFGDDGDAATPLAPAEPRKIEGIPVPEVVESDFGNLSSAKYFQNQSFGTFD
jgi:hypothetical protein